MPAVRLLKDSPGQLELSKRRPLPLSPSLWNADKISLRTTYDREPGRDTNTSNQDLSQATGYDCVRRHMCMHAQLGEAEGLA